MVGTLYLMVLTFLGKLIWRSNLFIILAKLYLPSFAQLWIHLSYISLIFYFYIIMKVFLMEFRSFQYLETIFMLILFIFYIFRKNVIIVFSKNCEVVFDLQAVQTNTVDQVGENIFHNFFDIFCICFVRNNCLLTSDIYDKTNTLCLICFIYETYKLKQIFIWFFSHSFKEVDIYR